MKTFVIATLLSWQCLAAFGQGQVQFRNYVTYTTPPIDARVYEDSLGGVLLDGNCTCRAALIGGPTTGTPTSWTTLGNLQMMYSPGNTTLTWVGFRTGTTAPNLSGTVNVGTQAARVVPGVDWGGTALVQMVAWEGPYTNWTDAWNAAHEPGATVRIGFSIPLTLMLPSNPASPILTYLWGLQPFVCGPPCLGPYFMNFTAVPTNQTVNPGEPVSFSVGAVACPWPTYQWYFNGSPIAGATADTYQIASARASDAGAYYAVLYGAGWGSRTSPSGILTVRSVPSSAVINIAGNDECSASVNTVQFLFGNVDESIGVFTALLLTTNDIGRQFTVTPLNDPEFRTVVSLLSNGTSDWIGYMVTALQMPGGGGCGHGEIGFETNFFTNLPGGPNAVDFQSVNITSFTLYLDELSFAPTALGTSTSYRMRMSVNFEPAEPPSIVSQPLDQTAEEGSSVALLVRAKGLEPMTCEWLFNGTHAFGGAATNRLLLLREVHSGDIGQYSVVLSNALGAVTSTPAMLNVIPVVERRPIAALSLGGIAGQVLNLETAPYLQPGPDWVPLDAVTLSNAGQLYLDTSALSSQRFYRAWQTQTAGATPSLAVHIIPAIKLTGSVGSNVRIDYINQIGPTDAWVTLGTVTLTNTSQEYFDTTAIGQPARLYRLVPLP